MQTEVKRACGHKETIDVFGPVSERKKKIEWYKRTDCAKCHREKAFDEVEMPYAKYKADFSHCKTKPDSYKSGTKTIVVYIPKTAREEIKVKIPFSGDLVPEGLDAEFVLKRDCGSINFWLGQEIIRTADCIKTGEEVAMLKAVSQDRLARIAAEIWTNATVQEKRV